MNLQRVQKLIALAGNNPNENEARTAAYLAVKAIVAGGFVLLEPHDPRLLLGAWAPPRPTSAARPAPTTPRPAPRPAPAPVPDDEPRRIRARFSSSCFVCDAQIAEGDRVYWRKGGGCWCLAHGKGAG